MHYLHLNQRTKTMANKYITEVDKLNNKENLITYSDGSTKTVKVKKINSRNHAINLCEQGTRMYLQNHDAFKNLHKLKNQTHYHDMRNYEIEYYLDFVFGVDACYRIDENCPFNGFKWFEDEEE